MADRIGHGRACAYCSSTRGPASCPALPPPRPRIHVWRFPERVPADRCFAGPWFVERADAEGPYQAFRTHAEAITAADKLAREQVGTAWTTPDSGTQADYDLATGSA